MDDRAPRQLNVVFVVCHPDDEALWIGGLLCELPRVEGVRASVICLSGHDPASPREQEFEAARMLAGYAAGVVLGLPLRPAGEPLPPIGQTTEEGLRRLSLAPDVIDLLITHSPYGDEHANPHHMQAYRELRAWTASCGIPFGYFSYMPMAGVTQTPVEIGFRRSGGLHLVSRSRCERGPAEYVQFGIDATRKREMLRCYRSIDLAQHERGYAAFTCATEGLYVEDADGVRVIDAIVNAMPIASENDRIFAKYPDGPAPLGRRIASKLRQVVGR